MQYLSLCILINCYLFIYVVLMSQENVWLDKLDKCLKKSVKTIATDAEEISEELDVSI